MAQKYSYINYYLLKSISLSISIEIFPSKVHIYSLHYISSACIRHRKQLGPFYSLLISITYICGISLKVFGELLQCSPH